jgi:hypothetical protein
MMKFKVTYEDGGTDTYKVKPKHILSVERNGGVDTTVEATYKLAHLASGSAEDFETWLNSVDDLQPEVEGEQPLPTIGE